MSFKFFPIVDFVETTGNPPSGMSHWKSIGTPDQAYVNAYALANTPVFVDTIYGRIYRQDIRVKQVAYDHFTIDIPYNARKNIKGEWTWDFDTTGGTVHITNGKQEVSRYPANIAPNQYAAINVDGDNVQGTEIVIPALKMNVTYRHENGQITIAKAKYLASITGTVNSDTFLTFAPGEVLFLGSRGSDGTEAEANVTYQFAMSANVTGQSIGDIAGIAKKGHEVIWIRFQDSTEEQGGIVHPIRRPRFVYVDRVYDTVPMALALGFGG